jgi:hypothetical protein
MYQLKKKNEFVIIEIDHDKKKIINELHLLNH